MQRTIQSMFLFLLIAFSSLLHAHPPPPKRPPPVTEVEKQLAQAQADFETAKKMFNPYYAGPLLTPSAHNVPPGHFNIQPYIFVTNTYAEYNENRRSVNITDIWQVQGSFIFQMGWLSWLDFTVTMNAFYNSQGSQDSGYWGDTQLEWGIQLMKEQPYKPAVRITISEILPTGRYKRLSPNKNGIDATGAGSYATNFSLNFTKTVWWVSTHPFSFRGSFNYTVPLRTNVDGFNAYGGGFGTKGKVKPGNSIAIDTSVEYSFTQNWVLAVDLVYTYQNHSTFSGTNGRTASGAPASVGTPSNDSLSCAPAIEYNPTEYMGFLAGFWFTITGRNSGDFISGIVSMTYYW